MVAYGLILPESIINTPRLGCINVHGSLLPRWRGAAPVQRSILAGDSETGITIIQMDTGLDTGNILCKLTCPISTEETGTTLCYKLAELGRNGLIQTLQQIVRGEIVSEVQDESMATYAKKLSKDEARINWSLPAVQLERCVRAFNPWPISWIETNGQLIKVWRASVVKISVNAEPGTIIKVNKQGIQVSTTENVLNLELLQPNGKRPMSAQDILNSHRRWFVSGSCLT